MVNGLYLYSTFLVFQPLKALLHYKPHSAIYTHSYIHTLNGYRGYHAKSQPAHQRKLTFTHIYTLCNALYWDFLPISFIWQYLPNLCEIKSAVCRIQWHVCILSVLGHCRNMAVQHDSLHGRGPAMQIQRAHSKLTKTHQFLFSGD